MVGSLELLILSVVLGVSAAALLEAIAHPIVLYFAAWSAIFLVEAWNPLGMPPVVGKARLILAVGQVAVFLGALLFRAGSRRSTSQRDDALGRAAMADDAASGETSNTAPSTMRLWLSIALLGLVVVVGVRSFESSVERSAGLPISALSPSQVRSLSGSGPVAHAGLSVIGLTLAALLAACGVIVAERRPLVGWPLAAAAVFATTVSPQRTNTLTALGLVLTLWLYRRAQRQSGRRRRPSYRVIVGIVGLLIVATVFFNTVGERLGKSAIITNQVHSSTVPKSLIPLTTYLTASPSALSTTLVDGIDPTASNGLRSIWLVPRVVSIFDPTVHTPDTVSAFTNIPFPFNTYTWQGDLYFDFGLVGVTIGGVLIGLLACSAYALAFRRRSVYTAWFAAIVTILTLLSTIEFAFLWLEMALWAIVGLAVFGTSGRWLPRGITSQVHAEGRQQLPSA